MNKRKIAANIVSYIVLILILIFTIYPLLYTIASSFKSNGEILAHPERLFSAAPSFANYKKAWTSGNLNVGQLLFNSIYYTLINVAVTMLISSMAGYVFARGHFKGKKIIFACFTSLMFIKLGGISIYATFKVLRFIHIPTTSLWSLMLVNAFGVPIVNMYLVKGYIDTLPRAIDEAAKVDGASFIGIFFRIIAPLLKPILATIGILGFQASWNDYLMPTIFTLTNPSQRTLIVGLMALKNSSGAATSWDLMLAGSTIALIPVLVAYGFTNKYFVSGLASGAVKG